jgi:uncharacterized membrane protein
MATPSLPGREGTSGPIGTLRESILTGLAIVIPALVTVYVLELVIGFLLRGTAPWVRIILAIWPGIETTPFLVDTLVLVLFVVGTSVLGYVVHFHAGDIVVRAVDGAIMRVPGVGTLYRSVSRVIDSIERKAEYLGA